MGRFFNSTTDRIATGTAAIPTPAGSVHLWIFPTWTETDALQHVFFSATSSGTSDFSLQKFTDNMLYCGWHSATDSRIKVASTGYTLNQNAWNSLLLTWDATSSILYLNGSQIGSVASPTTFSTAGNTRVYGNFVTAVGSLNLGGYLAEGAIWNAKLTASEAAALVAGVNPLRVRSGSVVEYVPLWGLSSPEPNLVAGGTAGTVTGTTPTIHAPVTLFTKKQQSILLGGGVVTARQQSLTLLGCGV